MPLQRTEPRKKLINPNVLSWMNYMKEEVIYDRDKSAFVRFLNRFVFPNFSGAEQDEFEYVCQSNWERLDKLAKKYYGDERLWWVIAARNGLELPDQSLYKGRKVMIPSADFVRKKIVGQQQKVLRLEP